MSSSRVRCVAGIRRHVPRQRLTFQSPPQISTPMSLSLAIRYSAPDKGETCTRFATIPPIVFSSRCSSLFDRLDLEISSITILLDRHRSRIIVSIFLSPFFKFSRTNIYLSLFHLFLRPRSLLEKYQNKVLVLEKRRNKGVTKNSSRGVSCLKDYRPDNKSQPWRGVISSSILVFSQLDKELRGEMVGEGGGVWRRYKLEGKRRRKQRRKG